VTSVDPATSLLKKLGWYWKIASCELGMHRTLYVEFPILQLGQNSPDPISCVTIP
jgi:hypothetical protein